ncbi:MAG: hypothetical protein R3D30_13925 [Hyphomicrobiales bacterium]
MNSFEILEFVAWAISILLGLWMIVDLIRTNRAYSEKLLLSSREGEIDDALVIDPTHQGGHR